MKCGVVEKMRLVGFQDVDFSKWQVSPIISVDYASIIDDTPLSEEKKSAMERVIKYLLKR